MSFAKVLIFEEIFLQTLNFLRVIPRGKNSLGQLTTILDLTEDLPSCQYMEPNAMGLLVQNDHLDFNNQLILLGKL